MCHQDDKQILNRGKTKERDKNFVIFLFTKDPVHLGACVIRRLLWTSSCLLRISPSCNFLSRPLHRLRVSAPCLLESVPINIFLKLSITESYCDMLPLSPKHQLILHNYLSYLPNPSARAGYDTRSIFLSGV